MLPFNTLSYAASAALDQPMPGAPVSAGEAPEKPVPLTNLEMAAWLRKQLKPYIGVMPKRSHFNLLRRIEQGATHLKPSTIRAFARRHGFTGNLDEWAAPKAYTHTPILAPETLP